MNLLMLSTKFIEVKFFSNFNNKIFDQIKVF